MEPLDNRWMSALMVYSLPSPLVMNIVVESGNLPL